MFVVRERTGNKFTILSSGSAGERWMKKKRVCRLANEYSCFGMRVTNHPPDMRTDRKLIASWIP
jgi:hypothetical protein